MTHVFVSYVRQNRDIVDRLTKALRDRGVTVWLDRRDLEPGTRWRDAIRKAIRNGRFFIACFSREYTDREKTYMNEELSVAIDELRERPSDKTWFIPVLLNETVMPSRRISSAEELADLNAINLYDDWDSAIERILRVLRHDDPRISRIWNLLEMCEKPFKGERLHAIKELGNIGLAEEPVVRMLLKASAANDMEIRTASLEALGKIKPVAGEATEVLIAALRNPDWWVRRVAARALEEMGPAAAKAVPDLIAALEDEDIWASAISALGGIGPAAADALPAITAALQDTGALQAASSDEGVRFIINYALLRIRGEM